MRLSCPRMTVEGVTFRINSLITAFKGNEEMDKTLRSRYHLLLCFINAQFQAIFILLVKVNCKMSTSFL